MPTRVLIVDAYDGPPWCGSFFADHLDRTVAEPVIVRAAIDDPASVGGVGAVLVTGSVASVNDPLPWIDRARAYVSGAVARDVPVLGVCWGHQLLATAVGVPVVRRQLPEVGFLPVTLDRDDPVIGALPARLRPFVVHEDEVPGDGPGEGPLVGLGHSEACALHAFRVRGRRAWGVQFHLEYPRHEVQRILELVRERHPVLGLDPEAVLAESAPLEAAARTLFSAWLATATAPTADPRTPAR